MLSYPTCREGIAPVAGIDACATHIDFGLLSGIDGSHDNVGRELLAGIEYRLLWDDKGIELVHTDILHVDIRHKRVQHLALGIAHVALQLGEQCDSRCHGHSLEHSLLPVLAQTFRLLGYLSGEIVADEILLALLGHHLQDALTERVDGIVELLTATATWSEHHL